MRLLAVLMALLATGGIARADGAEIFNANCVICHQSNGRGIPGMYPPLADSIGSYVAIPGGRAYLVHVVSFGMNGPISVHGQMFNGMMQPWQNFKDEQIAQVLNYVLTTFNAPLLPQDFLPLTSEEVKKYRTIASLGDVRKEREALLKALAAHHVGGSAEIFPLPRAHEPGEVPNVIGCDNRLGALGLRGENNIAVEFFRICCR